ncbi:hypothetical protein GJ496_000374 [Pomphorhynchus laevis]|nr:hypothetical protein GJ496_000374 [Pomphorhynchus laevis]
MPIGVHGRRMLFPYSNLGRCYLLPWYHLYKTQLPFRIISRLALLFATAELAIELSGHSDWLMYTPYNAIHHKINEEQINQRHLSRYQPINDSNA